MPIETLSQFPRHKHELTARVMQVYHSRAVTGPSTLRTNHPLGANRTTIAIYIQSIARSLNMLLPISAHPNTCTSAARSYVYPLELFNDPSHQSIP
jgi:hypothetical protein